MMMREWIGALTVSSLLVALSFFVLWAAKKTDAPKVTIFGYCTAAFLWVAAVLSLVGGVMAPGGARGTYGREMQPPPMWQGCPGMQAPGGFEKGESGQPNRPRMGGEHPGEVSANGAFAVDQRNEGTGAPAPIGKDKGTAKDKAAR
jgi:hypothetical protein